MGVPDEFLDGDGVAGQVVDGRRRGDLSVEGRLRADGGAVRGDGLPGVVPEVGALVHVDARDVVGGAVEVEVEAPEGGAEGVGEARAAFVVEGVGLGEDVGQVERGEVAACVGQWGGCEGMREAYWDSLM